MTYYKECFICGTKVITTNKGGRVLCNECRIERKNERDRLRFLKIHSSDTLSRGTYAVIHDPDPLGWMSKGAPINSKEHKLMLHDCCYTLGTILKDWKGEFWQVVKSANRQELIHAY